MQSEKNYLMTERTIVIEDVVPASLYGKNNKYLQMLCALYPKLRIVARDNVIRIMGDEDQMTSFVGVIEEMKEHILLHNSINEEDIIAITTGRYEKFGGGDDVIVYTMQGRPVKCRTAHQQALVDAFSESGLTIAVGPAGTGKTYLSIALAVRMLKDKMARKIILSRPAVEAGEKLGFLPGDMKDKIDPYLQPLYDALEDMLPQQKLQEMMEKRIIQIAPLAFMRGRTLNDAVIILDEAQNTTSAQLRMFLTRMGTDAKMILTGDLTQVDLPRGVRSGLAEAIPLLRDIEGIRVIEMSKSDIQRNKLVSKIVDAYEKAGKEHDDGSANTKIPEKMVLDKSVSA